MSKDVRIIDRWPTVVVQNQSFLSGLQHLTNLKRVPAGLAINPHPLPIYHLNLADVIAFRHVKSEPGHLVGWRYYAGGDSKESAASGDVDLTPGAQITSLSYGPLVWKAISAAEALLKSTEPAGRFEPRLLHIPALLIQAFWLRPKLQDAKEEEAGWIVPYHTLIKDLNPDKPVPIEDFMENIYPLAERAMKISSATIKT